MHKQERATYSKTDIRYWEGRVFRPRFTKSGETRETSNYSVQIQFQRRRRTFALASRNKSVAAARAKDIFLSLQSKGWEAFDEQDQTAESTHAITEGKISVGEFIDQARGVADVSVRTISDYARALRLIVADVSGIKAGNERCGAQGSARAAWLEKVHSIPLDSISPSKVTRWKLSYVRQNSSDPTQEKSAKNSANAYLRFARSLFSEKKVLRHLDPAIRATLPSPLPFEGVEYFPRSSSRYVSKVNPKDILRAAKQDLGGRLVVDGPVSSSDQTASDLVSRENQFMILILGLCAGLRRNEIDALLWEQFNFEKNEVWIYPTAYLKPKSEDSTGAVDLDPEVTEVFKRAYQQRSSDLFVIESDHAPRPNASYSYCRAAEDFDSLYAWLRKHGVNERKPLHTLRKEFGSLICQEHGLYVASRVLRHADPAVTASYYVDKKERVAVGLGNLLS